MGELQPFITGVPEETLYIKPTIEDWSYTQTSNYFTSGGPLSRTYNYSLPNRAGAYIITKIIIDCKGDLRRNAVALANGPAIVTLNLRVTAKGEDFFKYTDYIHMEPNNLNETKDQTFKNTFDLVNPIILSQKTDIEFFFSVSDVSPTGVYSLFSTNQSKITLVGYFQR